MRTYLFVLIFLLPALAFSQQSVHGLVLDSKTGVPLPFASVSIKGMAMGTITNEDGQFQLSKVDFGDTLQFSYLGYEKREFIYGSGLTDLKIKLNPKTLELRTFTVAADSDPYFDILAACRKTLMQKSQNECKAYLELHTLVNKVPGEIIEMYYNADVRSANLSRLDYKSGRQGIAAIDNSYFLSLSTSAIFQKFNLTEGGKYMPNTPLEMSKKKMMKTYSLSLLSSVDDDDYHHILFEPKMEPGKFFAGEIWVDKATYEPIEIKLYITEAQVKPFEPIFPTDSIGNVYMEITQRFDRFGGEVVPTLLRFEYGFNSFVPLDKSRPIAQANLMAVKPVHSDGIMYYYDYGVPFIKPVFDYQTNLDDYQKIQNTPYHEAFWTQEAVLLRSDRQEAALKFFQENGLLNNYSEQAIEPLKSNLGTKLDHTNRVWSDSTRLIFDEKFRQELKADQFDSRYVIPDKAKYNLNVELYLDIVEMDDTLIYFSKTVFDAYDSYYNLPQDSLTNSFINIHFDLCELARRDFESKVKALSHPTASDILKVHTKIKSDLDERMEIYFSRTRSGQDLDVLEEYNEVVKAELGIDNFELFKVRKGGIPTEITVPKKAPTN